MISGETEANRKPNENPYWHHFLRSVVDFDSQIKEKFNGRKSFSISTYGSLKYLTNQGGVYIWYENQLNVGMAIIKPEKAARKETYKELKFITRVLKEIYCIASDLGGALICDGDTSPSDSKLTTISDMLVENRK